MDKVTFNPSDLHLTPDDLDALLEAMKTSSSGHWYRKDWILLHQNPALPLLVLENGRFAAIQEYAAKEFWDDVYNDLYYHQFHPMAKAPSYQGNVHILSLLKWVWKKAKPRLDPWARFYWAGRSALPPFTDTEVADLRRYKNVLSSLFARALICLGSRNYGSGILDAALAVKAMQRPDDEYWYYHMKAQTAKETEESYHFLQVVANSVTNNTTPKIKDLLSPPTSKQYQRQRPLRSPNTPDALSE